MKGLVLGNKQRDVGLRVWREECENLTFKRLSQHALELHDLGKILSAFWAVVSNCTDGPGDF